MELVKISTKLFGASKAQKEKIKQYIDHAIEDGVVTEEERQGIIALAEKYSIPLADIDFMIQDAFKTQFKQMIATFAADGTFQENEMVALRSRAKKIGIDDSLFQMMLEEALVNHKEEIKKKIKSALVKAGEIAASVAVVAGGILLVRSSGSLENDMVEEVLVQESCNCSKCGRRIYKGRTAYKYKGHFYCCENCVSLAK